MVKMSHSSRKRLVPSKVKVKESRMSDPSSLEDEHDHVVAEPKRKSKSGESRRSALETHNTEIPTGIDWLGYHPIGLKKERLTPTSSTTTCSLNNNNNNNSIYTNGKHDFREQSSPLSLSDRSGVSHEVGQDETSSNGNKEDEDDDDDESEDKMDLTQAHDPERLKSFNMFVRLFVDENLDRMVPISKQPKEKIQAIIDSCTRQFPEFAERARKRIRTYLKSCRRNKRCRDTGGWESSRPTPAHLTSVQAEQILAQACENESQNAKRMRMGLEPIGQPLPASVNGGRSSIETVGNGHKENSEHGTSSSSSATSSPEKASKTTSGVVAAPLAAIITSSAASAAALSGNAVVSSSLSTTTTPTSSSEGNHHLGITGGSVHSLTGGGGRSPSAIDNHVPSVGVTKPTPERGHLLDYSRALNGNGVSNMSMYRPNFCQAFTRPIPFTSLFPPTSTALATSTSASLGLSGLESLNSGGRTYNSSHSNVSPLLPIVANGADIGPTDLSMKGSKSLLTHKLNTTEMTTVRTLITGYRESAAFLLRSADELEQLLVQQH